MSSRNTNQIRTVKLSLPTITFTLPTIPKHIKELPGRLADIAHRVASTFISKIKQLPLAWLKLPKPKRRLALFLILLALGLGIIFPKIKNSFLSKVKVSGVNISSTEINESFEFPLKDKKGLPTEEKIKLSITKVDRSKSIVVKGQNATAVPGRTFLIVNLKLENPTKISLSMKTRDFIRLQIEGQSDRLAPDIHNDPTEVQAISTKLTRVGFPVEENALKFKLLVGEIDGEKTEIPLEFNQ